MYKLNHTLVLHMRDVGVALRVRGQRLLTDRTCNDCTTVCGIWLQQWR